MFSELCSLNMSMNNCTCLKDRNIYPFTGEFQYLSILSCDLPPFRLTFSSNPSLTNFIIFCYQYCVRVSVLPCDLCVCKCIDTIMCIHGL